MSLPSFIFIFRRSHKRRQRNGARFTITNGSLLGRMVALFGVSPLPSLLSFPSPNLLFPSRYPSSLPLSFLFSLLYPSSFLFSYSSPLPTLPPFSYPSSTFPFPFPSSLSLPFPPFLFPSPCLPLPFPSPLSLSPLLPTSAKPILKKSKLTKTFLRDLTYETAPF